MFKFWARVALALLLALVGFILAGTLFLPQHYTLSQLRVIYSLVGFLIGVIIFSRIASWVVATTTRLFSQLILRIASEIINQFTHLASSGLHLIPGQAKEATETSLSLHPIILDTSAIIDGRILDIFRSGFLYGTIIIPNFILTELQQVSDSSDNLKRARGRRGFEIIDELKKLPGVRLQIWDKLVKGSTVDDQLIRLGKILRGRILTTDFNLNRVASVSNVTVLNVNELTNAVKTVAIPGEMLNIKIIHQGKDKDQGIGYLGDGTMVVVSGAADKIGSELKAEVTRSIQVPTGRMIFAKLLG